MEKRKEKDKLENQNFNWQVLVIITLGGIVAGLFRNGIMTLLPFIQEEFELSRTQVGLYSTFLYFSSTLFAVFTGKIADYWGVKRSMFWGLLLMGLFILMHSFAPGYLSIMIYATLTGLGLSIILPASSKSITEWFSGKNHSTLMGIMTLGLPLGGIIGAVFLPWLGKLYGWRMGTIIMGGLFFLSALLFRFYYIDKTSESKNTSKSKKNIFAIFKEISLILNNKYILTLCFLGLFFGISSGVIVTHFTIFLVTEYNLSKIMAGIGFMFLQIGSMVGRPLWGILNDKLLNDIKRRGFLFIGLIISFASFSLYLLKDVSFLLTFVLIMAFLLGGTGRGWHGIYFSSISSQVGKDDAGLATGLSLFFIRMGILSGPPIFGFIADVYDSYRYSWLFLGVVSLIIITISYYFLTKFEDLYQK